MPGVHTFKCSTTPLCSPESVWSWSHSGSCCLPNKNVGNLVCSKTQVARIRRLTKRAVAMRPLKNETFQDSSTCATPITSSITTRESRLPTLPYVQPDTSHAGHSTPVLYESRDTETSTGVWAFVDFGRGQLMRLQKEIRLNFVIWCRDVRLTSSFGMSLQILAEGRVPCQAAGVFSNSSNVREQASCLMEQISHALHHQVHSAPSALNHRQQLVKFQGLHRKTTGPKRKTAQKFTLEKGSRSVHMNCQKLSSRGPMLTTSMLSCKR